MIVFGVMGEKEWYYHAIPIAEYIKNGKQKRYQL